MSSWWHGGEAAGVAALTTPAAGFHPDGRVFRQDDGAIVPWAFGSEFALLRRWLDGVDLAPLVEDRRAVGQQGMSVFLTSEIAGDELPGPYQDGFVLDGAGGLADWLHDQGFQTEFCAFQGLDHGVLPGADRQIAFWDALLEEMAPRPSVHVSLSKEIWKQTTLPIDRLRQPAGQNWDGGATADGLPLAVLGGQRWAFQPGRSDEWPRKTKSAWDVVQQTGGARGCCSVEPMGADEVDQPGRRSCVPDDFFWSAANSRLLSQGSYFHSTDGIGCRLFRPTTRQCALAHFAGLTALPTACQLGRYAKAVPGGQATATSDELRTYGMLLSDAEQWVVVTRPGPQYPRVAGLIAPAMLNGWIAAEQTGLQGTVLHCRR